LLKLLILLLATNLNMEVTQDTNFTYYYESNQEKLLKHILTVLPEKQAKVQSILSIDNPINIVVFLCGDQECWSALTGGQIPEWGVGAAFPEKAYIVLQAPGLSQPLLPIEQVIAHELAHIYLYNYLGDDIVPLWFNEGFAMYIAEQWSWDKSEQLKKASIFHHLISFPSISNNFPYWGDLAHLAYAESISAFNFLYNKLEPEGFLKFLTAIKSDGDFETALTSQTGLDLADLEDDWQRFLKRRYLPMSLMTDDFTLWMLLAIAFMVLGIRAWYRTQQYLKENNEPESDTDYYLEEGE
jgi:hypothetical protein